MGRPKLRTLFLIDDDSERRDRLMRYLRECGHIVNGAVETADLPPAQNGALAIVIETEKIPVADGSDLLDPLSARHAESHAVLITNDWPSLRAGTSAHRDARTLLFVRTKPPTVEELGDYLDSWEGHWSTAGCPSSEMT